MTVKHCSPWKSESLITGDLKTRRNEKQALAMELDHLPLFKHDARASAILVEISSLTQSRVANETSLAANDMVERTSKKYLSQERAVHRGKGLAVLERLAAATPFGLTTPDDDRVQETVARNTAFYPPGSALSMRSVEEYGDATVTMAKRFADRLIICMIDRAS